VAIRVVIFRVGALSSTEPTEVTSRTRVLDSGKNKVSRHPLITLLTLAPLLSLPGCQRAPSHHIDGGQVGGGPCLQGDPAQMTQPFTVTATIKELMDSTVDPSADGLWDAVATVSTLKGTEERRPRTQEQWQQVRRFAVTLVEATNLIIIPGRRAAPAGTPAGPGELPPEQIDRLISTSRPAFVALARSLNATARKALETIDRQDAEALLQTGGEIDSACEACQLTFWYPPRSRESHPRDATPR
jgi:hypothetical protein